MAVIISDNSNANYDGNLSTANSFYRVEAHNLGNSASSGVALSTERVIPLTIANAGNALGAVLSFYRATACDRDILVKLQENVASVWTDRANVTVTASNLALCVIGGLTNKTFYAFEFTAPYAVTTTASTWRLSVIQTGGTTGNWTIMRADTTTNNFCHALWCDNQLSYTANDCLIVKDPITLDQSVSLRGVATTGDTTRSVCGIACYNPASTGPDDMANLLWDSSPASAYTLNLDGFFYLSENSGFRVGTSASPIPSAQKANITVKQTPTIGTAGNSGFIGGNCSFFLYGEKPTYRTTDLASQTFRDGNVTMTIASPCVVTRSGGHELEAGVPKPFHLKTTGALPTGLTTGVTYWALFVSSTTFWIYDTEANALAGGATGRVNTSGTQSGTQTSIAVIQTSDSTGWAVGDYICVTKGVSQGIISNAIRQQIDAISGTMISPSLAINMTKLVGTDTVFVLGGYGVEYRNDTITNFTQSIIKPINFNIEGAWVDTISFTIGAVAAGTALAPTAYMQKMSVKDCGLLARSTSIGLFLSLTPNELGIDIDGNVGQHYAFFTSQYHTSNPALGVNGAVTVSNNIMDGISVANVTATNTGMTFSNNKIYNSQRGIHCFNNSFTYSNNYWYGFSSAGFACIQITGAVEGVLDSNTYENCGLAYLFNGSAVNIKMKNETFTNNTYDFAFNPDAVLINVTCTNPSRDPIVDETNLSLINSISRLAIVNSEGTANKDLDYLADGYIVRTGDGLADTTSRLGGTGNFATRFQSTSSSNSLRWSFNVPTGNIGTLTMNVGVWIKINNAAYYAGTHQNPRLTINFDNGTETYATASDTTDWQFINVPFTPTTSYGIIDVRLSSRTDATGSNAYVYFDDLNVAYPAGVQLNLGNMNLWADGLPITPPISTGVNANDVWSADPTTFATATVGDVVNKTLVKADDASILNGIN